MSSCCSRLSEISWFRSGTINYFPVPSALAIYFTQLRLIIAYFLIAIRCKHTFSTVCMFCCNWPLRTSGNCSNLSNMFTARVFIHASYNENKQTNMVKWSMSQFWMINKHVWLSWKLSIKLRLFRNNFVFIKKCCKIAKCIKIRVFFVANL